MTRTARHPSPSTVSPTGHPADVVALGWSRWRILTRTGAAAGLIEQTDTPQGVRYRALRYRWSARAFQEVGGFWRFTDAVAALRNG